MLHTAAMEYISKPYMDAAGEDIFIFRLTDGDGDEAENSVIFTSEAIPPASPVTGIDQLTFREENLHNGTNPDYMELVKNGRLFYDPPSGLANLQIANGGATYAIPADGFENLITDKGIFSVWHEENAIAYSFILSDPLSYAGAVDTLRFEAILTDGDGNIYSGNDIFIHIFDDAPKIIETRTWTIDETNPAISGNANDYFLAGADGGVFEWKMSADLKAEIEKYGSLTLDKDGAYAFALNASAVLPDSPLILTYGFEDLDGDSITGNIYIDFA